MSVKLYVGNISYNTIDQELHDLFASVGSVTSCKVVIDRHTGRSRGFAFVEMASKAESENAVAQLDGWEIDGRALTVATAKPKQSFTGETRPEYRVDSYIGYSGRAYLN